MEKVVSFVILAGLLLSAQTNAAGSCNIFHFAMQGGYTCGLQWWNSTDLAKEIDVTYKVSELATNALDGFQISVSNDINSVLNGNIGASSNDPFSKIVESGLTVEPYILYLVADLVLGTGITSEELSRFGIPGELANKENLITMYSEYMDFSCTNRGVKRFVSCMENWIGINCSPSDEPQVLLSFMEVLQNVYCDGTKFDDGLKNRLDRDVGTVYSNMLDMLGIYKDTKSPFLFNISADSVIFQTGLTDIFVEDCGFFLNMLVEDGAYLVANDSSTGAGFIAAYWLRAANSFTQCVFREMHSEFPEIIDTNLLDRLNVLGERYGMETLSFDKIQVATEERYSVNVYGDPHMLIYKASEPITCSAFGWRTYLSNEFFSLRGYAEPAVEGSAATYITKIDIKFHGENQIISYDSGIKGELSRYLEVQINDVHTEVTKAGSVKIDDFGSGLTITQINSGAVFGIRKYRETYYFTVRMGEKVYESSLGLLITGCTSPPPQLPDRRKRSIACETACAGVDGVYTDTCVFDCDITGDFNVAEIAKGVVALNEEVKSKDDGVLKDLGVTIPPVGSSVTVAATIPPVGSSVTVAASVSLFVMMILIDLLLS